MSSVIVNLTKISSIKDYFHLNSIINIIDCLSIPEFLPLAPYSPRSIRQPSQTWPSPPLESHLDPGGPGGPCVYLKLKTLLDSKENWKKIQSK